MRDIRSRESGMSNSQTGISMLDVEGGNSPGYAPKRYAKSGVSGFNPNTLRILAQRAYQGDASNVAVACAVVFALILLIACRVSFTVVLVLLTCAGSLAFAAFLAQWVLDKDEGTPDMTEVSDAIREGADGFFATQGTALERALRNKISVSACMIARPV